MATSLMQPESRRILSNLIFKLSSPDSPYARFSKIIDQTHQLEEKLYSCVRIDILVLIDSGRLQSIKTKRSMDTSYSGRAIYLHAVRDSWFQRFYVGQALNLHKRLEQHMDFRYRRDNLSLHYRALQRSKEDYYVILAYVLDEPGCQFLGIQHSDLFIDLLETWCCLMFRTLPLKYLEEFLPKDVQTAKKKYENLNIQLPLQTSGPNWPEVRDILLQSPDPLSQDFYLERVLERHHETHELIENNRLRLEFCKRLDRISTPSSASSRPTLLSPPASDAKITEKRLQSQATKEMQPSTPSSTTVRAVTKTPKDYMSLGTGLARVEASNLVKSKAGKRKWEPLEETPSKLPGSRPAKIISIDDEGFLVTRQVNRKLDFEDVAEPKECAMETLSDISSDSNDLSDNNWNSM